MSITIFFQKYVQLLWFLENCAKMSLLMPWYFGNILILFFFTYWHFVRQCPLCSQWRAGCQEAKAQPPEGHSKRWVSVSCGVVVTMEKRAVCTKNRHWKLCCWGAGAWGSSRNPAVSMWRSLLLLGTACHSALLGGSAVYAVFVWNWNSSF